MATLVKTWTFRSNSNPNKTYETSQYDDGSTSCQCKGWCIARGGERSCTHTRKVAQGIADQEALSVWESDRFHIPRAAQRTLPVTDAVRMPSEERQKKVRKKVAEKKELVELPRRAINWR
jgi:hypothetical protein